MATETTNLELVITAKAGEILTQLKTVENKIGDLKNTTSKTSESVQNNFTGMVAKGALLANGLTMIAGKAIEFGKALLNNAMQMEEYQAKIASVVGSTERAGVILDRLKRQQLDMPFELPGIIEADSKLRIFGQDAEKYLPMVGNLAAGTHKSIEETAQTVARAFQGDSRSLMMLSRQFGISQDDLKSFGADFTKNTEGKIKNIDSLKDALEKFVNKNYFGAMAKQEGTLKDAIGDLKTSFNILTDDLIKTFLPRLKDAFEGWTLLIKKIDETITKEKENAKKGLSDSQTAIKEESNEYVKSWEKKMESAQKEEKIKAEHHASEVKRQIALKEYRQSDEYKKEQQKITDEKSEKELNKLETEIKKNQAQNFIELDKTITNSKKEKQQNEWVILNENVEKEKETADIITQYQKDRIDEIAALSQKRVALEKASSDEILGIIKAEQDEKELALKEQLANQKIQEQSLKDFGTAFAKNAFETGSIMNAAYKDAQARGADYEDSMAEARKAGLINLIDTALQFIRVKAIQYTGDAIMGAIATGGASLLYLPVIAGAEIAAEAGAAALKSSIQNYAIGIDRVPYDMIANIHEGERIVTKENNSNYNNSKINVTINANISDKNTADYFSNIMIKKIYSYGGA